jgi:regulator of sigma E protease
MIDARGVLDELVGPADADDGHLDAPFAEELKHGAAIPARPGVVGSYEATRQSFDFDTVRAISILALISLSLGIINLFPFLPLDGGHIFWALAEKVRGRAIPFAVMERAGFVGFALVLALFAVGLSNDIDRLANGGFSVR